MQIPRDGTFNWKIALVLAVPAACVISAFQASAPPAAPARAIAQPPAAPAPTAPASAPTGGSPKTPRSPLARSLARSLVGATDHATPAGNAALVAEYTAPAADHSGSSAYQKEWWMVKGAIRAKGYPCAAVAYVTEMADGTFKTVCKFKRGTDTYVAFTIDPDARTVVPVTG